MNKVILFPGQGSQSVGMGKNLYENFRCAKDVFDEVDDALGQKLSKIIFEGPEEDLTLTENTQPALMTVSMAVMRILEKEFDIVPAQHFTYAAGHSLGEYSALCCSHVFSLADTARLLKIRGTSMQKAVPVGQGAMAAIINLSFDKIADITQTVATDTGQYCDIANDNSEGQIVISGHKEAIDKACDIAKSAGAKRALLLPVSAPFHSGLMQPAAVAMEAALSEVTMQDADMPVIANVSVTPVTVVDDIRKALIAQVTGRVRWRETMAYFADNNIETAIEAGSGKVLTGLLKRAMKDVQLVNLQNPDDIELYAKSA
ncbi:MAG: ACP S-malonyltransferase [Pseudomonadota bacterium]